MNERENMLDVWMGQHQSGRGLYFAKQSAMKNEHSTYLHKLNTRPCLTGLMACVLMCVGTLMVKNIKVRLLGSMDPMSCDGDGSVIVRHDVCSRQTSLKCLKYLMTASRITGGGGGMGFYQYDPWKFVEVCKIQKTTRWITHGSTNDSNYSPVVFSRSWVGRFTSVWTVSGEVDIEFDQFSIPGVKKISKEQVWKCPIQYTLTPFYGNAIGAIETNVVQYSIKVSRWVTYWVAGLPVSIREEVAYPCIDQASDDPADTRISQTFRWVSDGRIGGAAGETLGRNPGGQRSGNPCRKR